MKKKKIFIPILLFIIAVLLVVFCKTFFAKETKITSEVSTPQSARYVTKLPADWTNKTDTPGLLNAHMPSDKTAAETESLLSEEASLLYYEERDTYCYGITKTGQEIIAFLNEDGSKTDALSGAGTFAISDKDGQIISYASYISNLEIITDSAVPSIRVSYAQTKGNSSTLYEFYPDHIAVTASLSDFPEDLTGCYGALIRNFPQSYIDVEKRLSTNWIFPDNNDFPYPAADSYVLSHYIDSTHKLYSFVRGDSANPKEYFEYMSDTDFALKNLTGRDYTLEYTIVPELLSAGKDSDYLALFKGRNNTYAAGITALTTQDSSSVFDGFSQTFNLNVTNLEKEAHTYQMDYRIYNYDGESCASDSLSFSLEGLKAHNENIYFESSEESIYYLDYTVTDEENSYHELYPFMLLGNETAVSDDTSPFGISGMHFGAYEPNETTISLAQRLGMKHARVGISTPEYIGDDFTLLKDCLQSLKEKGIHVTGQFLVTSDWSIPEDTSQYTTALDNVLKEVSSCLDAVEVGNEPNYIDYYGFSSYTDGMNYYQNSQVLPTYELITKKYKLPFMSAGVYQCQSEWLNLMAETGLFEESDILTTHAYGYPHSPDFTADPSIEHSFESALVRTRTFLDTYGDKTWYLSEFGLPTTPGNSKGTFSGSDLRSQADYTVRSYLLALSYGADVVESYSFYDQHNMFKGMESTDGEYHFGMFYDQDYYGRILPKPLAMAYAGMTTQLAGYQSCVETETDSDTLRCFEVTLAQPQGNATSKVSVLWSTKNPLTNDCADGCRTPNLPWQNQWSDSENYTLSTDHTITVCDLFGNKTEYEPVNGSVTIPITGSPVYLYK